MARAVPNGDSCDQGIGRTGQGRSEDPSARELYDYWSARRGLRAAPERSDIEPGAIRRALADTFIVAYDRGNGHAFRIAGARLCAAFGRELRGAALIDLWDQEGKARMHELLGVVARECIGVVAGARGRSAEGTVLDFELLLLPLHDRTAADAASSARSLRRTCRTGSS